MVSRCVWLKQREPAEEREPGHTGKPGQVVWGSYINSLRSLDVIPWASGSPEGSFFII